MIAFLDLAEKGRLRLWLGAIAQEPMACPHGLHQLPLRECGPQFPIQDGSSRRCRLASVAARAESGVQLGREVGGRRAFVMKRRPDATRLLPLALDGVLGGCAPGGHRNSAGV